jgi:hypothetical protein
MKCPECGKEMEHGTLQIENEMVGAYGVRWFQQDEKIVSGFGGDLFHLYRIRKPGVMCRDCKLITLRWSELARHNEDYPQP